MSRCETVYALLAVAALSLSLAGCSTPGTGDESSSTRNPRSIPREFPISDQAPVVKVEDVFNFPNSMSESNRIAYSETLALR